MKPEFQISLGANPVKNYEEAVSAFGGSAVASYLPEPDTARFDGLILSGGADVEPGLYGQENTACFGVDKERDEAEFRLIAAYVKAKKPILGICRGHQILNVYFGGSLFQNLETAAAHVPSEAGDGVHQTEAASDCFLNALYGTHFPVNSAHHQGIDRLGEGLTAVQWAADGVVEACQHRNLPIWSVQWHPERMCLSRSRRDTVDGGLLFRWFIQAMKDN